MNNNTYTIDLGKFRVIGSKVFTGRDRGENVRKNSALDSNERNYPKIKVVVPDDIYSINPSFLEEFFVNVVQKLGKEEFLEKFEFEGKYNIQKPLNEAIDRILRKKTAIG